MTAPCNCLAEQSELLRVENTQLVLTWCSDTRQVTPTLRVQEIDPRDREPVVVVPLFCPFCGVPYAAAKPPASEVPS